MKLEPIKYTTTCIDRVCNDKQNRSKSFEMTFVE